MEELNDILKNFDNAEICSGFTDRELRATNGPLIERVKNPTNYRYKACEMLVVHGELRCCSCKYFDVLSRRKVSRECSKRNLSLSRAELRNELKKTNVVTIKYRYDIE